MNSSLLHVGVILSLLLPGSSGLRAGPVQTAQGPVDMNRMAATSVVYLTGEDASGQAIAPGSGFFLQQGLIITSYQLVRNAVKIRAKMNGQEEDAEIAGVDSRFTLALLKAPGFKTPPEFRGFNNRAEGNEKLYVLSNPDSGNTPHLEVRASKSRSMSTKPYFVIRESLKPESAGAPVINRKGEVIGIVAGKLDEPAQAVYPSADYLADFSYLALGRRDEAQADAPAAQATQEREGRSAERSVPPPPPPPPAIATPGSNTARLPATIRKSGGVLQGSALRKASPCYPAQAKADRLSGAVVVEVTIGEEGEVVSARGISGHPLLKEAAVSAARAWKWPPTTLSGQAVRVIGAITFNFTL